MLHNIRMKLAGHELGERRVPKGQSGGGGREARPRLARDCLSTLNSGALILDGVALKWAEDSLGDETIVNESCV